MAKTFFITLALIVIIVLLLIIAAKQPALFTKPSEKPQLAPEPTTPRAPIPQREPPSQRAPEQTPIAPGVPAELAYPQELHFWVNDIRVPPFTTYEGGNFIPIKEDDLKTFAGSFGPYYDDPTQYLNVILCSELYKVAAAPSCERVPIVYRNNYVSFARGYQFDEYIGGMAAKDYLAYYDVFAGEVPIARGNKAVIRTVKD